MKKSRYSEEQSRSIYSPHLYFMYFYYFGEQPELLQEKRSLLDLKTWETAEALGRYYLEEALRCINHGASDSHFEYCRKGIEWLKERTKETFTSSNWLQNGPRPRPKNVEALSPYLDTLVEYGYIQQDKINKTIYYVNPHISVK